MSGDGELFELAIGGLRFSARLPAGARLVEDDPSYRDFLNGGPDNGRKADRLPGEILLPVTLSFDEGPDLDRLPAVFDAGTWSAHGSGGETILRLRTPQGPGPYLWLARLAADRFTVHCGPLLVEDRDGEIFLNNPLHYPLDQLLTMFVLAPRRGLVCHAAGIARGDRGALFAGRSGAGKTTFLRLCGTPPDFLGLSDDRVIIRQVGDRKLVYGTPWAGEGRVASNRAVPLAALVFLHKSPRNELRPISAREALEQLLPVASILWFDQERMEQTTALCGELVQTLPSYELHFRPEKSAIDLLDELF